MRSTTEKKMSGIGSLWHWIVVALIVLILFGRGRISETMGDFGKGIRSFRKGLGDEGDRTSQLPPGLAGTSSTDAPASTQPVDATKPQ